MELQINKRNVCNSLFFSLLIILSFIPNIGISFATAGFYWTPYRIIIGIIIIGFLALHKDIMLKITDPLTDWILFMGVWVVYGTILLFTGKYSVFHTGFVELLSLVNGLIVIYIMSKFLASDKNREYAMDCIYWLLNCLLIFGLFEIATGWHWITSMFSDESKSLQGYSRHVATGFMYNINDFSAMLTCMSPILINRKFGKKRLLTFIGILFINITNDATTCTLAIVIFIAFYFLILIGGKTQNGIVLKSLFWILSITVLAILIALSARLVNRKDFIGAMARQIFNAKSSMGSLYARIILYKDTIKAWLSTGALGIGPGGFSNYFTLNTSSSGLINPHSLILEILLQYGIIVTTCFVGLLIKAFLRARIMYESSNEVVRSNGLMIIAFVIIYALASFAPSSFITYSYQWMLIAVMFSQLRDSSKIVLSGGIN